MFEAESIVTLSLFSVSWIEEMGNLWWSRKFSRWVGKLSEKHP